MVLAVPETAKLLIGTVIFSAAIAMVLALIPGAALSDTPYKERESVYFPETIKGRDFSLYNNTLSFNMSMTTPPALIIEEQTIQDLTIRFHWAKTGDANYLYVTHVEKKWLGTEIPIFVHPLLLDGEIDDIYSEELVHHYNNATDSVELIMTCEHLTLSMKLTSNDTNYTFFEMFFSDSGHIHFDVDYDLNLEAMGANVWQVMSNVLTFSLIRTDVAMLDLILNVTVSLPMYIAIIYLVTKFITAIIPFIPGL